MRIRNWEEHQHYKNRNPPWIRFHKKLLDDPDFFALSGDDFKVLAMCWLVASEDKTMKGLLPGVKKLSFRFRMTEEELKSAISRLSEWILSDASELLADSLPTAEPNISTDISDTETDTPNGEPSATFQALSFLKSAGVKTDLAKEWLKVRKTKRAVNTETAFSNILNEIDKAGKPINDIIKMCVENSWSGFKASWLTEEPTKGKGSTGECPKCMSYIGCSVIKKGKPPAGKKCFYPTNVRN